MQIKRHSHYSGSSKLKPLLAKYLSGHPFLPILHKGPYVHYDPKDKFQATEVEELTETVWRNNVEQLSSSGFL